MIRALSASVIPFNTVSGTSVPTYWRSNVLNVSKAPRTVKLPTTIEAGKLAAVDGVIPTAFQFWFVMNTDCELLGGTPNDHDDASSQKPLVGLVQLLTAPLWAEAMVRDRTNAKNRQAASVRWILGSCIARLIPHVLYGKTNGVKTDVKFRGA